MSKRILSLLLAVLATAILSACASRTEVCETCINRTDERLMDAAAALYPDAVKRIIEEGAYVNATDAFGETALMKALRQPASKTFQNMRSLHDTVAVLLESGAGIRTKNKNGVETLELLLKTNDIETISLFDTLMRKRERDTMLMRALMEQQFDVGVHLLKTGANPKLLNEKKQSLLHFAVNTPQPNTELLTLLLDAGNVNLIDDYGTSPLMVACANGAPVEVVKTLLDRGADPKSNINGQSLLWLALTAKDENVDLVGFLLKSGFDANESDAAGIPVLVLMAKADRVNSARMLIDAGADVAALDRFGAGTYRSRLNIPMPSSDN